MKERLSEDLMDDYLEKVPVGSMWTHVKSGGLYKVMTVALNEQDLYPLVIYRMVGSKIVWSRPMDNFLDGRFKRET